MPNSDSLQIPFHLVEEFSLDERQLLISEAYFQIYEMSTDKNNNAGESSSANLTDSVDIADANKAITFQPDPETSKPKKKKKANKKLEAHQKYQEYLRTKSKQDDPFEIIERSPAAQTSRNGGKDENLDEGWADGETLQGDSDDDDDDDEPLRLEWEKFKMKMDIGDERARSGAGNVGNAAREKRNQRPS